MLLVFALLSHHIVGNLHLCENDRTKKEKEKKKKKRKTIQWQLKCDSVGKLLLLNFA